MKRFIGLLVALTLLCGVLPAYAAGGLTTTEETWYVTPHSKDWRVYYYATVENTGDAPEMINDLLFEIEDAAGTAIESTTKYKLYPEVLQPGETGWLVISQDVKDIEDKSMIDQYALTFTSKMQDDEAASRLQTEAEFRAEDADEKDNVLRAAVTNSGEDEAFEITVAMAARDADGKLLYVDKAVTKEIGLAAGSALLVRTEMNSDIVDALKAAGTEVTSVDAVAYTVVDLDD